MNAKSHVNCDFWQFIQWIRPFSSIPHSLNIKKKYSWWVLIASSNPRWMLAFFLQSMKVYEGWKHTHIDNNGINPINYLGTWVFTLKLFSILFSIVFFSLSLAMLLRKKSRTRHPDLWNLMCVSRWPISHRQIHTHTQVFVSRLQCCLASFHHHIFLLNIIDFRENWLWKPILVHKNNDSMLLFFFYFFFSIFLIAFSHYYHSLFKFKIPKNEQPNNWWMQHVSTANMIGLILWWLKKADNKNERKK